MAKPWDITGDDIELWSRRIEASAVLPDLVRRLLLATAPIGAVDMRADGGTRLGGWDGVVQSFREFPPYCPRGQSAWELTVQGDAGKLNNDFIKRTIAPPPPVQPGATTYVAVTARRFPAKLQWAADRRALGKWIDVRLLDADDLATWLSQAPAVGRWFAARLEKPAYDMLDLDAFLARWTRRTAPPLPIELALAGRERGKAAEYVRDWARAAGAQPLVVQGDTQEEALIFAAAALALAPAPEDEFWRARTLVVESAEALRWASRIVAAESLILLPSFEGPAAALVESKAHIVVPLDRSTSGAVRPLILQPAPHRRFAEILVDAGFEREEADRRSAESGGKLSSLARLYGYVALPGWANSLAPVPLATMLLIGAFQPENEADREVVRLVGAEPRDVEGLCERLRIIPDAAMERDQEHWGRAVWRWSAHGDAWKHLVGSIPAETLRRFEEAAGKVLGMRDPRLDLHPDQRFTAQVHGKVLLESPALRDGIARSLIRLAMSDTDLSALHGVRRGSGLANTVVRRLLQPAWPHWASVADLLPLLAEAAPEVFLDCLEASLRHGDGGAAHLLAEEGQFGSPHTGLLWALEMLGWSDQHMSRVASALVDLAAYDRDLPNQIGRMANRPAASLHNLLHVGFAQTRASAEARRETWRRLIRREIGYEFALDQLESVGQLGFMMPGHPPLFRHWTPPSEEDIQRRAVEEYGDNVEALVNLAIEHTGIDTGRWVQLLHAADQLSELLKIRILNKLEASRSAIVDTHGGIWAELRRWLHFGTSDSDPMRNRSEWYACAERLYHEAPFLPDDPVVRYWWLFEPMVEPPDREAFFTDDDDELKARRVAALTQIWDDARRRDLLARLASFNKSTGVTEHVIGQALAQAEFAAEVELELLGDNPGELAIFLPSYVSGRLTRAHAPDWLEHLLRRLIEQQRLALASDVVRFQRPTNELWSTIARIGEPLHSAYWRDVSYVGDQAPDHDWGEAISQLLRHGNIAVALDAVDQGGANVSIDVVNNVLRALRESPEQTQRVFNHRLHLYRIERVLARFDNDAAVDREVFGHFAILVAEVPQARRRSSKSLSAVLEKEFVSLVAQIYRGDNEDDSMSSSSEEERKRNASAAFRRLSVWEGYPGEGLDATEREQRLLEWARETLQLCVASGHGVGGTCEVAKVLARAPGGSDGHWPCMAARQLVESGDYPTLSRELDVAKENLRGMYGKSLGEGGKQEREIAAGFQSSADSLRAAWPRTAALLDGLARSYERAGEEEDQEARADLRRTGAEPEDFATKANDVSPPQPKATIPPVAPGIVRLDTVHLKDLYTIEDLELQLEEPESDRGQWIVLLGENGSGKTTFLRALALTLTTHNTAIHAYGNLPADAKMLRAEAQSASCVVKCSGKSYHLELTKGLREVDLVQHPNGTTPRPLVFGYGCRRGSAFGGERAAEIEVSSGDIVTLFDPRASVKPAFGWLKDQKRLAMEDPVKQGPIFKALMSGLCMLLPGVSDIDVHGDNVWVTAPALGGNVPMAALSDGYLTTIGWVVDLLARWLERAEDLGLPVTTKFYEEMTGVVLLDEVDLHLHPRWQLTVISDVRRLFRRMSFVITTHNPAAVVGAKPGEIWILTNDNGRIRAEQRSEPPKLMTGSEIYTSYFGIPHMSPDLAEKMQRYGFLAGKTARIDEEESEVQRLLIDLRTEGVDPGWEPVPRAAPRPRRAGKKKAARP